jgi:hypothetical protein
MIGAGFPKEVEDKISEKFMPIATKRMAEVFQLHLTDRHYAAQRILYDTEERFDLAADMMVEMGNASAISSQMMQLIHEDLAKDL